MQADPNYLTDNHIRIFNKNKKLPPSQINWYSTRPSNYKFQQDPGNVNSLGSIRINFPSAYGVYMHDTPSKNLFGDDFRFVSSGCMRVQNVRELVDWLLDDTPGWDGRDRRRHPLRRAHGREARQAGAALLGLYHGLGDARTASCSSATTSTAGRARYGRP